MGTPGVKWGMTINENMMDSEGVLMDKHNDVSILHMGNRKQSIGTLIGNYGKKMKYIHGTIDKTGVSSFTQKFPSSLVLKTKTSAGTTSATQAFKSVDGVKVGDKIYSSEITPSSSVTVNS